MIRTEGEIESEGRSPLYRALLGQPTRFIAIPATAAGRLLLKGPALLGAVQLREASGGSAAPTSLAASTTAAAAAQAPALPAPGAGITNWVTGFQVTGAGATAGSVILVTLVGVVGGPLNYELVIPAGAGVSINPLNVEFPWPGLPAAAPNAAVTLNVPSFGAGNTAAAAAIEGYSVPANSFQVPGSLALPLVGDLEDSTSAGGEEVLPFALPLGGALNQSFGEHGPLIRRGVFLDLASGTVKGAVWAKYLDRA